jgi:hypothetical protein
VREAEKAAGPCRRRDTAELLLGEGIDRERACVTLFFCA